MSIAQRAAIAEQYIPQRVRLARAVAAAAGCTPYDSCYLFAAPTVGEALVNHASRSQYKALENKTGASFTANSFMSYDGSGQGVTEHIRRDMTQLVHQQLPDVTYGGNVGRAFTCTGIAKDPDGTWWVGNYGKSFSTDSTFAPSIVHVSADFTTKLGEIGLVALYPSIGDIQGLAYDSSDDTLWFASKTESKIRHISKAGAVLADVTWASPNAITYDSMLDCLIVDNNGPTWVNKTTGATIKSDATGNGFDHFFFDASIGSQGTLWCEYGTNGMPAGILRYDIASKLLTGFWALSDVQAPEGIHISPGGVLTITDDARFHDVGVLVNGCWQYQLSEPMVSAGTRWAIFGKVRSKTTPAATKAFGGGASGETGYGISILYASGGTNLRLMIGSMQAPITANWTVPAITTAFRFYMDIDLAAKTAVLYINGVIVSSQALTGVKASLPDLSWSMGASLAAQTIRGGDTECQAWGVTRVGGKFAETDAALAAYLTYVGAP